MSGESTGASESETLDLHDHGFDEHDAHGREEKQPHAGAQQLGAQGEETDPLALRRGRRLRRRVVVVSEVDQRLIDRGLPPSWEERVSEHDRDAGILYADSNDVRLLENVPPHAQPRL